MQTMASISVPTVSPTPHFTHSSQQLCIRSRLLSPVSPSPRGGLRLCLHASKPAQPRPTRICAAASFFTSNSPSPASTRTIASILSSAVCLSKLVLDAIIKLSHKLLNFAVKTQPGPEELARICSLREARICSGGPLFFAARKYRPSGYLNTPLTVVAAGMSKWLDIYTGVLMVRVMLTWFPNIPWDRQPLSAIRDLCDPYLNLFRNIIPPVFNTLDVSPVLAFSVLGILGSILSSCHGKY